jgi:hypothetical protein
VVLLREHDDPHGNSLGGEHAAEVRPLAARDGMVAVARENRRRRLEIHGEAAGCTGETSRISKSDGIRCVNFPDLWVPAKSIVVQ